MNASEVRRGATVLVVEDELWLRRLIANVLNEEGHSVITAANGASALAAAASVHPQFILLDITLPEMDGMAILRELRRRGERGVVVMLTGRGDFGSARQAMLLGADHYITKPFDLELLKGVLRERPRGLGTALVRTACAG